MVVACLALFLSGTGTGIAVSNALPKNSVGTAQLKNNAVVASKIKNNAIVSSKIKNGSLKAIDFAANQLPKGPKGDTGPTGPAGDKGDKGDKGDPGANAATNVVVRTQSFGSTAAGSWTVFRVDCHAGERAVGGGAGFNGNAGKEELQQSYPAKGTARATDGDTPTGWFSIIKNNTGSALVSTGYVVCVSP
jgi:hypothetical protein